jgi:chemotaxis protein histidine kinase CheA
MKIESAPGEGTTLAIRLPFPTDTTEGALARAAG